MTRITLATALAVIALPTAAAAVEVGPLSIPAGKPAIVYSYGIHDESCNTAPLATAKVIERPAHGTVEVGKCRHRIDAGLCSGRTIATMAVGYRSAPGYHGPDRIVVEFTREIWTNASAMGGDRVVISLTVK